MFIQLLVVACALVSSLSTMPASTREAPAAPKVIRSAMAPRHPHAVSPWGTQEKMVVFRSPTRPGVICIRVASV